MIFGADDPDLAVQVEREYHRHQIAGTTGSFKSFLRALALAAAYTMAALLAVGLTLVGAAYVIYRAVNALWG